MARPRSLTAAWVWALRQTQGTCRYSDKTIQAVGLRIPEDIALLVMDDFEALSLLNPSISVVAQPSAEIAEVGWRMLRQLIADEKLEAQHVRLPAKLIVRGSTPAIHNGRKR